MLHLLGLSKRFPGVQALDGVTLDVAPATCHALVGENGAGKSTLGRILSGIDRPDRGEIQLDGRPVRFASPRDAAAAGVALVHQELCFCENMSVAENLRLNALPRRGPFLARRELTRLALADLARVGGGIDPWARVGDLAVSRQQLVQIASALSRRARLLIFDEPTSSLSRAESRLLFDLIRKLRAQGVTSIYISHRLDEVFELCDAVSVLRDGRLVETRAIADIDAASIVRLMIGRPLQTNPVLHMQHRIGRELLRVENLTSAGKFSEIGFSVHAGEIVGLAGLVGSGRTEIAQAIFGLDPAVTGRVFVRGAPVRIRGARDAMRAGLGLIPEDRKRHGLVLPMTIAENMTLSVPGRVSRWTWLRRARVQALAMRYFQAMRVRAAGVTAPTATLSGGNQQKVVIAKWLAAECPVLLVDEPTRGVDVGAKAEIHGLLDEIASQGAGLLLISSDLPEIINMSTRILVLRAGRLAGEVSRAQADQDRLMRLMTGLAESLQTDQA